MKTKNYHGEEAEFSEGQTVTHVDGKGGEMKAVITAMSQEHRALMLDFEDGSAGSEYASTCY